MKFKKFTKNFVLVFWVINPILLKRNCVKLQHYCKSKIFSFKLIISDTEYGIKYGNSLEINCNIYKEYLSQNAEI